MMKAIWTGSIGFGLVNIPIKLYSAISESSLDLDMLDKKDHANIKFKRVNEHTGKEVVWSNIVKGYKMDDKYVVLEDTDFEKASPEKTKHIEITQFTDADSIDSVYYETPYFIEAEKSGGRAYVLLREALKKTNKVGVANFVMKNREHICIIKCREDYLLLNRIRFAEEVRNAAELKIPEVKTKPAELKMAEQLVEQLSAPFDISSFKDEYTDKLLKIIKAKSKGQKVPYKPMKIVHSASRDLMDQLKASLSSNGKKRKAS